jgi:hypothetical protein
MKVVVRSSSLLFFFVNLLLGLPVHRRLGTGLDRRRPVRENTLATEIEESGAYFEQSWPPWAEGIDNESRAKRNGASSRTAPQN